MILPPKRYQDPSESKYDPIRHHLWFQKLIKRRKKVPALKQALSRYIETSHQINAAKEFNVDVRELRAYGNFVNNLRLIRSTHVAVMTHMLDSAYADYCSSGGKRAFTWYVKKKAPLYGKTPKQAVEVWEADPTMYPTNYQL